MLRIDAAAALPKFVEVVHADRALPYTLNSLKHVASLRARAAGSSLAMPGNSAEDLRLVHDYLSTGTYGEPRAFGPVGPPRVDLGALGAPLGSDSALGLAEQLGALDAFAPDVAADFRAARLGATVPLPELEAAALKRLNCTPYFRGEPVALLELAYFGSPDEQRSAAKDGVLPTPPGGAFRAWVQQWLTTCARPDCQHRAGDCITNYQVIDHYPDGRRRLQDLKAKGGPIVLDLDQVKSRIARGTSRH